MNAQSTLRGEQGEASPSVYMDDEYSLEQATLQEETDELISESDVWIELDETIDASFTDAAEDERISAELEAAFEAEWEQEEWEDELSYMDILSDYPADYESDEEFAFQWDFEEEPFGDLIDEIDMDYADELWYEEAYP